MIGPGKVNMALNKEGSQSMEQLWDAGKIKGLRQRLGWSQSDLARRMACESKYVRDWEEQAATPDATQTQTLEMIFQQAEVIALEMTQSVQAEVTIQQNSLDFIEVPRMDLPTKS